MSNGENADGFEENVANDDNGQTTEEVTDLAELGLDAQVVTELQGMFDMGLMRRDELDQRAIDGLRGLEVEQAMAVLEELKGCNLPAVTNKSAYMCGIMKTLRQKLAAGLMLDTAAKRPGPDENKLREITDRTGYTLEVTSGQRKYGGPPPNYDGPAPGSGQEIFVGKLPNNVFEDVLIPLFEKCGLIWDLRLMMDPSTGYNKTFCFVTYTTRAGAEQAVKMYDNYEIKPGKRIKVNISVAKLRLFVGNIPKQRSKDEIIAEFSKVTEGIKDIIIYTNPDEPTKKNRGFCFIDFDCHKNASGAKRKLENGQALVWNRQVIVSWAEPQEEPDEDTMAKVKVLYVKNLKLSVTEENLRKAFEPYGPIERVKKAKDYGFIHFENREDAIRAMEELNGTPLDDSALEISLAKPPSKQKKQQGPQAGIPGMGGPAAGAWGGVPQRGGRGRGRGRGAMQPMGYGAAAAAGGYGAGGGYDQSYGGYESYDYDESYGYGYDDYSSYGGDYSGGWGADPSYGYGGGYGAPPAMAPAFPRGRGGPPGGMGRGAIGGRGGPRGAGRGAAGAAFGGPRGRGGRGAPGARGAGRGGIGGMKRKAPEQFQAGVQAKKMVGGDAWGGQDAWSAQPIAQQPLGGDAQWYQDSWQLINCWN